MAPAPVATVAVPARNEGAHLRSLLRALARQRAAPPFALCLFFDGCDDDGAALVAALAPSLPFPVVSGRAEGARPPNAGRARAAAAALALDFAPTAALLTTDADSEPEPDWVAANVRALGLAEVVAGRILLDDPARAPVQARLGRYYDRLHRHRRLLDPVHWEDEVTHHWTSGASLAFRPAAYRAIGGFLPHAFGEDADIADRAWRAGCRLRRDARAIVRTSTRRNGRACGGFAAGLERLDTQARLPRVAHPHDEAWRYRWHAQARHAFDARRVADLAIGLGTSGDDLDRLAGEVANADAFAARAVGTPPGGMRSVSLARAEALLASVGVDILSGAA